MTDTKKEITAENFKQAMNRIGVGCSSHPLRAWKIHEEEAGNECFDLAKHYHQQELDRMGAGELPGLDEVERAMPTTGGITLAETKIDNGFRQQGVEWMRSKALPVIAGLKATVEELVELNKNEIAINKSLSEIILSNEQEIESLRSEMGALKKDNVKCTCSGPTTNITPVELCPIHGRQPH
jgi:hypothetical protein